MILQETSGHFEIEQIQAFFLRIKPLVDAGLSQDEILQVQKATHSMPVDSTREFVFPIEFRGNYTALRIRIFMDEHEVPEISFFTHRDLAEAINDQMISFLRAEG